MALLDVIGLTVRYRGGAGLVEAVSGASLSVGEGEFVALVGGSGSGKSTVAWAVGRLTDYMPCQTEGSILFKQKPVFKMDAHELLALRRREIAYVFQDPAAALNPVMRVEDQILEVMDRPDRPQVRDMLRSAGIEDAERVARAFPHELSGGMKQRAVIAMALAKRPSLLIADEPTSALDAGTQRQVLRLFLKVRRERKLSTLFITHDLNVARAVSDRILVMHEGRVVENVADPRNLAVRHPYAVKLLNAAMAGLRPKELFEV